MDQTLPMNALADRFVATRAATLGLIEGLSPEDCMVQSMPDASPVKWHLAHTSWFFETFLLEAYEPGFRSFDPAFREIFNSYYVSVGPRHARPARGVLSRPSLEAVLAYRQDVEQRLLAIMDREIPVEMRARLELGLAHEEQHQELILTDLLHHFSCNPLLPAARAPHSHAMRPRREARFTDQLGFCNYAGGLVEIGHDAGDPLAGFAFDNESPRHRVWLEPYALAQRPVTQGEFARFIADGGYRRAELWLSEGWDHCQRGGWEHPLYWHPVPPTDAAGAAWNVFSLEGLLPLDTMAPVSQLSYFEADAYARWAGARLPTEMEWEHAARQGGLTHTGHVWEWTASAYTPYPGFAPAPSALGEYNGKFMVNQMVLRGGSQATPPGHVRPSYRNFFPASARWQFSGLRIARNP